MHFLAYVIITIQLFGGLQCQKLRGFLNQMSLIEPAKQDHLPQLPR